MSALLHNGVFWSAFLAWLLAQGGKVPLAYIRTRKWDWGLWVSPGGMPSSHSALVSAAAWAAGLWQGFGSPLFGVAVAFALIVIYDATGVRRQAGEHAALLNRIVADLQDGHLPAGEALREVLGHTQWEAFWGVVLGIASAYAVWFWWGR
ncbi:MAG TPA: divergent PAP2 family protein [Chloroflexi bacterium]|nr:divergent PAP2 family protein [Chloroflexota bacterium]